MISALAEWKDLLEDAVSEAILDMKIGLTIDEGDTAEFVPESEDLSKLMVWSMELLQGPCCKFDNDENMKLCFSPNLNLWTANWRGIDGRNAFETNWS